MRPTFSGFYTARSGIQAARAHLDVTGNNLANINQSGYTRQRLDTTTIGGTGLGMQYADVSGLNIGNGVSLDRVSQIRDPFLDRRYRTANAAVGSTAVEANGLGSLEDVFNEVSSDNGIQSALRNLISSLSDQNGQLSNKAIETATKGSCETLVELFHDWSKRIDTVWNDTMEEFNAGTVNRVNDILKNIASLNTQIKEADVVGTPALNLLDSRNLMLDELSSYMDIEVEYSAVSVGAGRTVDEMKINFKGANGTEFRLLDHNKYGNVNLKTNADGTIQKEPVTVELENAYGNDKALDGTTPFHQEQITGGQFDAYLRLLNDNGIYDSVEKSDLDDTIKNKANRINELLATIATANNNISNSTDAVENKSKRSAALAELQTYLDLKVTTDPTNEDLINVSLKQTNKTDGVSLIKWDAASGSSKQAIFRYNEIHIPDPVDPTQPGTFENGALTGLPGDKVAITITDADGQKTAPPLTEGNFTSGDFKHDISRYNTTKAGKFESTDKGIGYYKKQLDTLARSFAEIMNKANSNNTKDITNGIDYDKPMFSNGFTSSSTSGITAENISISSSWTSNTGYMTFKKDGTVDNLLYMKDQLTSKHSFTTPDGNPLFNGTMIAYASDISNSLGSTGESIQKSNQTHSNDLSAIIDLRMSQSSADMNEEGVNMMIFSQALNASSRVMTTLDEAIDILINKMGIVGR